MFRINDEKLRANSRVEHILEFLGYSRKNMTELHEKKHIIDSLIAKNLQLTGELSADLYTCAKRKDRIGRDVEKAEKGLKPSEHRLEELKHTGIDFIIKKEEEIVEKRKQRTEDLKNFPFGILENIRKKGLPYEAISFIIPMTHFDKLYHRLELVDKYLEKRPEYLDEKDLPDWRQDVLNKIENL